MRNWIKVRALVSFIILYNKRKCPICLEHLSGQTFTTNCNHIFHRECLDKWNNKSCPCCRQPTGFISMIMYNYNIFRFRFRLETTPMYNL